MAIPVILFIIVSIFGNSDALNCFGNTCANDASQYCLIQIATHTGTCYTHHGHGHHEDHQACIGSHHPHDHCFCHDQACIDKMGGSGMVTAAPTGGAGATTAMAPDASTMAPASTTVPVTMPSTTTTTTLPPVSVLTCAGNICITPLKVCQITYAGGKYASGACVPNPGNLQSCSTQKPADGDCMCTDATCMANL